MARDKNNRNADGPTGERPGESVMPGSTAGSGDGPTGASTSQGGASSQVGTSEWTASDERDGLQTAPETIEPDTAPTLQQHAADRAAGTAEPVNELESATTSPSSAVPLAEPQPARRRSLWPVAAGVIVGAIIGAGSAAAVYETQNSEGQLKQQVASLSSRLDTLSQRPDASQALPGLQTSVKDLDRKVAETQRSAATAQQTAQKAEQDASKAASKATRPGFDPTALQQKVAALQSGLDALQRKSTDASGGAADVASLKSAVGALQKQDGDQGGQITNLKSTLADVRKQSDAEQGKLAAIAVNASGLKSLDTKVSAIKGTVDNIQKQVSSTQSSVAALQSQQKGLEGRVAVSTRAVAADDLLRQVSLGVPFAAQTDALAALGADPARIAVLHQNASQGVPSARSLAGSFRKLADSLVAVEYKAPKGSSLMDRLRGGVSSLVSVRSTNETTGSDLASRVSLIQAKLRHGDVIGAYSTWDTLPADAKGKSKAWGAEAKTSAEAMTAALGLREQAISDLGGKKS